MQIENVQILNGKKILLGVCSSISVYKSADLCSRLVKLGAEVVVMMTENATKLISPRVFQTLSRNQTYVSMWVDVNTWKPEHVSLADWADMFLVAPATANTIGNFANGLAPDMMSSTFLATAAKVLIAPAMNVNMFENPAVQANIETLRSRGVDFVEPESGMLACGIEGKGRFPEPEAIICAMAKVFGA